MASRGGERASFEELSGAHREVFVDQRLDLLQGIEFEILAHARRQTARVLLQIFARALGLLLAGGDGHEEPQRDDPSETHSGP